MDDTSDEDSEGIPEPEAQLDADLRHPRSQLVGTFNATCDSIAMSESQIKSSLMKAMEDSMNKIMAQARAHPAIPQTHADTSGTLLSMIPASNKKRSNNVNKT